MTTRRLSGLHCVFIDTSAFFAVLSARDSNHHLAVSIMTRLVKEPSQLFSTNFILAETHALILTRVGRHRAWQFVSDLEESSTTIIRVSASDEQKAKATLKHYNDKSFSLTDCTSFAVMERLKITEAFAFDRNFSQYGLRVLTQES